MTDRNGSARPIAIYYEHPEWFKKLFDELDRRDVKYEKIEAHNHRFDPTETESPYSVILNRMSPSAWGARAYPCDSLYAGILRASQSDRRQRDKRL